jgi:hypothetical protein
MQNQMLFHFNKVIYVSLIVQGPNATNFRHILADRANRKVYSLINSISHNDVCIIRDLLYYGDIMEEVPFNGHKIEFPAR